VVPFEDDEEVFTVLFDRETELLDTLEAMRYKEATDESKILWRNEVVEWRSMGEFLLPAVGSATWIDEGTPWAVFEVEDVTYNVNVSDYIRASGP
jgi:hypothetical protein